MSPGWQPEVKSIHSKCKPESTEHARCSAHWVSFSDNMKRKTCWDCPSQLQSSSSESSRESRGTWACLDVLLLSTEETSLLSAPTHHNTAETQTPGVTNHVSPETNPVQLNGSYILQSLHTVLTYYLLQWWIPYVSSQLFCSQLVSLQHCVKEEFTEDNTTSQIDSVFSECPWLEYMEQPDEVIH